MPTESLAAKSAHLDTPSSPPPPTPPTPSPPSSTPALDRSPSRVSYPLLPTAHWSEDADDLSHSDAPVIGHASVTPAGSANKGIAPSPHALAGPCSKHGDGRSRHPDQAEHEPAIVLPSACHRNLGQDQPIDVEKQSSSHQVHRLITNHHSLDDEGLSDQFDEELEIEHVDPAQYAGWVLVSSFSTMIIVISLTNRLEELSSTSPFYLPSSHYSSAFILSWSLSFFSS